MADAFFRPVSGVDVPRFAGVATFMRRPQVPFDPTLAPATGTPEPGGPSRWQALQVAWG